MGSDNNVPDQPPAGMPGWTWGVIEELRQTDELRARMVYNEVMTLRTELDEAWAQLNRLAPEDPGD